MSTDVWDNVPRAEIEKELRDYFRDNPTVDSVWVVPARFLEGDWTCVACCEFPYSNINRRLYRRSFERVYQ